MNYTIDGTTYYIERGHLHRDDGPAVINADYQEWYQHGQLDRRDGPARLFRKTHIVEFWFNGNFMMTGEITDQNKWYIWWIK